MNSLLQTLFHVPFFRKVRNLLARRLWGDAHALTSAPVPPLGLLNPSTAAPASHQSGRSVAEWRLRARTPVGAIVRSRGVPGTRGQGAVWTLHGRQHPEVLLALMA